MNIELGTLMSLKSRADDIVSELVTLYINTTRELSKSVNNIESSGLKEKNRELLIYISDNYSKTVKNLRHCIKFMDAQIKAYDLTKEEISKSINTLINTIYLSLDSEGNIIRSFAKANKLGTVLGIFNSGSNEEIVEGLLALYNGELSVIGSYENFSKKLYEELDLASAGYTSGAEFINDVIDLAKASADTNRGKAVNSVLAFANLAGEVGTKANYDFGGGHTYGTASVTSEAMATGIDCSSFVSWGVQQGSAETFDTQTTAGLINSGQTVGYDNIASIQPGDIAVWHNHATSKGHTVFILENRPEEGCLVVAEAYDYDHGVIVQTRSYQDLQNEGYVLKDMSQYYGDTNNDNDNLFSNLFQQSVEM